MRLVYVTSTLPFGTAEAFVIAEIDALRRRGHDVRVVPVRPRGPVVHGDARRLVALAEAAPLLSPEILRDAAAALARPRARQAVVRVLLRGNPRVRAKNLAVLPKALWLARLLARDGADHVHAHWGSTPATVAMVASVAAGVPWSFTVHRWDIAEDNLLAEKAASARFVRAISADGLRDLRMRVDGNGTTVLVHMGVEPSPRARGPTGRAPTLVVLVPAALVPVKGHAVLLHALALLPAGAPRVAVQLAGDGPLRNELRRLADALGVADRVTFLGQRPHDGLLADIDAGAFDLVALPSRPAGGEKEGIPVSLLEAMARGVPVLASDVGAVRELLDGGAGELVPPGDAHALAGALGVLAADPDRRAAIADAGRRRVLEHFTVDAAALRLAALFAQARAP